MPDQPSSSFESKFAKKFNITAGAEYHSNAILGMVEQHFKAGVDARRPYEKDWQRNAMFLAGHQFPEWDGAALRWRMSGRFPPYRVRLVENRILPITQAWIAMVMGGRPKWDAMPGSEDQADRVKAMLATKVLDAAWYAAHMRTMILECVSFMAVCGNVAVKTDWNEGEGPFLPVAAREEDGTPIIDQFNRPAMVREGGGYVFVDDDGKPVSAVDRNGVPTVRMPLVRQAVGDVTNTVIPPYNLIPDPWATKPSELRWVIHHAARPMDYIAERWPDKADEVQPENLSDETYAQARLSDYYSQSGRLIGSQDEAKRLEPGAIVKELTLRPCAEFPRGALTWVASNVLLEFRDELDKDCQETASLGIAFGRACPTPGRFWSAAPVDAMIGPQQHHNKLLSHVLEIVQFHASPKWKVPRLGHLRRDALNNAPNEKVEYDAPFAPEVIHPAPIPGYILRLVDRFPVAIQEVMSIHKATLGQTPGDLRSGVAISLVQGQDEDNWSLAIAEKEQLISSVGRRRLALMRDFYETPRLVHVMGDEVGEWDVEQLQGADLRTVFDVHVVEGSTAKKNIAAQRAYLLDLMNGPMGAALVQDTDPVMAAKTQGRILEALDQGHIATALDKFRLDAALARRENKLMERGGQPAPVTEEENLAIHARVHEDWLKNPTKLRLKPEVIEAVRTHWRETMTRLLGPPPQPQMMGPGATAPAPPMEMPIGGGTPPPAEQAPVVAAGF